MIRPSHWLPDAIRSGLLKLGLVAGLSVGIVACERSGTPDWDQPGGGSAVGSTAAAVPSPAPTEPKEEPVPSAPVPAAPAKPAATAKPAAVVPAADASAEELRFITYNVRNWLTMDRYVDRKSFQDSPKPDDEKKAVISILARHQPDALGLCEIGTAGDLAEIQEMLKSAGVDLPHSHFTGGSDQTRHLGFLSRHPITAIGRAEKMDFQIQGKMHSWNRGILDVTIQAHGRPYQFLGVHLKSKREVEEGDQEEIRRSEARLLRRHVDGVLEKNPEARLIVYGDFNDTRSSVAGKQIFGNYNDPTYLTAIPATDSAGTRWTHFWALHDVYSRIDFIAVSKALKSGTVFNEAKILDDPEWEKASDHRAILAIFR